MSSPEIILPTEDTSTAERSPLFTSTASQSPSFTSKPPQSPSFTSILSEPSKKVQFSDINTINDNKSAAKKVG